MNRYSWRSNFALAIWLVGSPLAWVGDAMAQAQSSNTTQAGSIGGKPSIEILAADDDSDLLIKQAHLYVAPEGYLMLAASRANDQAGAHDPRDTSPTTAKSSASSSALTAEDRLELNLDGNALLNAKITKTQANALIDNSGLICGGDGNVMLTASGRDQALKGLVNHSGVVRAQHWRIDEGRIILDAEPLDAQAKTPAV